jgi:smad nuclear-interacting protein 1
MKSHESRDGRRYSQRSRSRSKNSRYNNRSEKGRSRSRSTSRDRNKEEDRRRDKDKITKSKFRSRSRSNYIENRRDHIDNHRSEKQISKKNENDESRERVSINGIGRGSSATKPSWMTESNPSLNERNLGNENKAQQNGTLLSQSSTRQVWGNVGLEDEENRKLHELKLKNEEERVKANFGLTGALAKDTVTGNVYNGVLLKWSEPLDAARPNKLWKMYVYKDDKIIETIYLHRQSAYLCGREPRVCDLVLLHPSCSKQHAVIQFRQMKIIDEETNKTMKVVKPYLMDLQSANKTYLNNEVIDDSRYYELKKLDGIRFGESTREYVLICEE